MEETRNKLVPVIVFGSTRFKESVTRNWDTLKDVIRSCYKASPNNIIIQPDCELRLLTEGDIYFQENQDICQKIINADREMHKELKESFKHNITTRRLTELAYTIFVYNKTDEYEGIHVLKHRNPEMEFDGDIFEILSFDYNEFLSLGNTPYQGNINSPRLAICLYNIQ